MSDNNVDGNRKSYRQSVSSSQDLDIIDSSNFSLENSAAANLKQSTGSNEAYSLEMTSLNLFSMNPEFRREETYIEKLKNFGTNFKFNLGSLGQSLIWRPEPNSYKAYLLGEEYDLSRDDNEGYDYEKLHQNFSRIIWFSYRKNFPKLTHSKIPDHESYVNDTGWGCMIRSCQMVFAQALKKAMVFSKCGISKEKNPDLKIIKWFLDSELKAEKSPYSIQTLSNYLYDKFKLKPGIWFKPSSVLLALQKIHQDYGIKTIPEMGLEIFLEGTIYINQILRKMTKPKPEEKKDPNESFENEFEKIEDNDDPNNPTPEEVYGEKLARLKRLNCLNIDGLLESAEPESLKELDELLQLQWKGPTLLVVLAKIGLDKPNPEYFPFIKELLEYPQSLGMIGGKPGLAFYIAGYTEDKLIYLDPHFVQETVHKAEELREKLETYYNATMRYLKFSDIDTSVAMAFFIKNEEDFKEFVKRFYISCSKDESFLGLEISPPEDNNPSDFESVGEEDDFETIATNK